MHGDAEGRAGGIPCILPSMGLVQKLVGVLASQGVDGEEAFIVFSVRVLDDGLEVFCTGRDGGESGIEEGEHGVPLILFLSAAHAELCAVVGLDMDGVCHVMAS